MTIKIGFLIFTEIVTIMSENSSQSNQPDSGNNCGPPELDDASGQPDQPDSGDNSGHPDADALAEQTERMNKFRAFDHRTIVHDEAAIKAESKWRLSLTQGQTTEPKFVPLVSVPHFLTGRI